MARNQKFIIARSKSGVLYKRYYDVFREPNGLPRREFYYSEKLNIPEQLLYKYTTYYDSKSPTRRSQTAVTNKTRKKQKTNKKALFLAATLLAGAITLGAAVNGATMPKDNGPKTNITATDPTTTTEPTIFIPDPTLPITPTTTPTINPGYVVPDKAPTPVTYFSNGVEFISLESLIEISKYNHAQLVNKIEEYNKTAPENKKINFDTNIFTAEFFAAIAIQENSLKITSPTNPNYKGCYQMGSIGFEEASLMAKRLGFDIPESLNELENPVLGNLFAMCLYTQNFYRYIEPALEGKNFSPEDIKAAVTTAYLEGGPTVAIKIKKGQKVDSVYHTKIALYSEIVMDYSNQIYAEMLLHPSKSHELDDARAGTFSRLYKVTNDLAKKVLAEKQQAEKEQ